MSDTPRTDENEFDWVTASFARKLERQLNAANERIKRLEEAGDALCENLAPSRWDLPAAAAQKLVDQSNWHKAKDSQ